MKQQDLGLNLSGRRTREEVLLNEMAQVMPWAELVGLTATHAPVARTGRPPFDLEMDAAHPLLAAMDWAVGPGNRRSAV